MSIDMGDGLHAEVTGENILFLNLRNATTPEEIDTLRSFLEKSHDLTVETYNSTGNRVCGLIDLTEFTEYSPEVVSIISQVLRKNKPYIEKTATYGATPFVKLAQETVYALAGRSNFGAFDTKEEALTWLKNPIEEE